MHTVDVREMDGSLVITLPAEVAEELHLKDGAQVMLQAEGSRLEVAAYRPRYSLQELLSECDFSQPVSPEEREWMDAPSLGREVLG